MSNKTEIDIEGAAKRLKALGTPVRLSIYRLLVRAGSEGRSVGDIQDSLDIPSSTLSFHIRHLVDVGLVKQDRFGTTLICHADDDAMEGTLGFLHRECCHDETVRRITNRRKTANKFNVYFDITKNMET